MDWSSSTEIGWTKKGYRCALADGDNMAVLTSQTTTVNTKGSRLLINMGALRYDEMKIRSHYNRGCFILRRQ